jgi:hypothetical protein
MISAESLCISPLNGLAGAGEVLVTSMGHL